MSRYGARLFKAYFTGPDFGPGCGPAEARYRTGLDVGVGDGGQPCGRAPGGPLHIRRPAPGVVLDGPQAKNIESAKRRHSKALAETPCAPLTPTCSCGSSRGMMRSKLPQPTPLSKGGRGSLTWCWSRRCGYLPLSTAFAA